MHFAESRAHECLFYYIVPLYLTFIFTSNAPELCWALDMDLEGTLICKHFGKSQM